MTVMGIAKCIKPIALRFIFLVPYIVLTKLVVYNLKLKKKMRAL